VIKYIENSVLLRGKCLGCIELNILPDEISAFNYIAIKQKDNKQINVIDEKTSIDNIDRLKEIVNSKIPLCLVINGKGIISKKILLSSDDTDETIIQKVLPNALPSDFYIRLYRTEKNNAFVSLIRKTTLDNVIGTFSKNKIFVVEVFWGPFVVSSIIPLLGQKKDEFCSENFKFTTNGTVLTEYSLKDNLPNKNEYFIVGSEKIEAASLISLSGLIYHFFENTGENTSGIPLIQETKKEYIYSQLFIKILWASLIIVFAVLLINFILFDHFNKNQQKLSEKVSQFSNLLINQDTLNKELQEKQSLLEKSGFLNTSKISFYADRIAATLTEGLTLSKLSIFPVEKIKNENSEESNFEFKSDYINISGTSAGSIYLNEWIKKIKIFEWVKEVTIKSYNQENNLKPAVFILEIQLKQK
jgi:hypothetical protein